MNNAQNGEKNVNIQTSKNRRVINRKTLEFLGRSSSNCQPVCQNWPAGPLPDGNRLFFKGFC